MLLPMSFGSSTLDISRHAPTTTVHGLEISAGEEEVEKILFRIRASGLALKAEN